MYKKDYQLGDLGILYLSFHGSPGEVYMEGDLRSRHGEDGVNLDEIAESLTHEESEYDCSDAVVHFASCSVLRAPKKAKEFKEKIGAAAVSGYTKSVGFLDSWAFELMYLALLSELLVTRNVNAGTLGTLEKNITSKPEYAGLAEHLGFTMIY